MAQRASEEVAQQWKENILKQRESGLSITSWCRNNSVAVHTFYYWRNKFFSKAFLNRSDFSEIGEKKKITVRNKSGIFIEYEGICIHLDSQFDASVLKQCLEIVRKVIC